MYCPSRKFHFKKFSKQNDTPLLRLTRISIILIFIYILCHMWKIPPSIYEAWYYMVYDTTTMVPWPDWLEVLNDISHVLIQANSAFNFIIYLVL